jgi:hypothetical protein
MASNSEEVMYEGESPIMSWVADASWFSGQENACNRHRCDHSKELH